MNVLKLSGILLLSLLLLLLLRELKVRHTALFTLGAALFFLACSLTELWDVFSLISSFGEMSGEEEYFKVLLKALGIGVVTGFLSDFCRDLGENTLSRAAELCGKSAILTLSLPILKDFLALLSASLSQVEA